MGAIALGGGLHRLPRQIGLKPALGIILTGRKVGAAEGKALGFVNEVVPQTELAATVDRWAADILRCSPVAIQASKEVVHRGLAEPSLADAMRNQRDYAGFRAWLESEDFREGPRAFAEKRPPNWSSREPVAGIATDHDDWKMALSRLAADRDAYGLFAVPRPPSTAVGQQDLLDMRQIVLVGFDGQGVAPPHAHPALVIEPAVISGALEDPCSSDRLHLDVPAAPSPVVTCSFIRSNSRVPGMKLNSC